MGHRQILNTPQIIETETEADQGWNHTEHLNVSTAPESSSISHPRDMQYIHFQWAHAPGSTRYSSSTINDEIPRYPLTGTALQKDHQSTVVGEPICAPRQNYLQHHHPSSSSGRGLHSVSGSEDRFYEQTLGSSRGSHKRKSPCIVGSSSDQSHWEYPPNYGFSPLSIGGDGMQRNLRNRVAVDSVINSTWTPFPSSSSQHSFGSADQSNASRGSAHTLIPPSSSDSSFNIPVPSSLNLLSHHSNTGGSSSGMEGYSNDIATTSNHVSRHLHWNQSGSRHGSGQRSDPGHMSSAEHLTVAENQLSRARSISNFRLRNTYRNGRISMSSDRLRHHHPPVDAGFPDQFMSRSLMFMNNPVAFYGSRAMFDQHRAMRLDIDNMTYEELLALGDRIGTVNTGLSDSSISECLTASTFRSTDEGSSCVICLEEYEKADKVGILKACGHDFHVGCIRKWLSIKNMCPICKATAMETAEDAETVKGK